MRPISNVPKNENSDIVFRSYLITLVARVRTAGGISTPIRAAILGRQTGDIVVRILKGEKAGDIDVKLAQGTDLFVNPKMAARMGIQIPASATSRATKIIK